MGVNVSELIISQPDSGEQALEIADTLIKSGAVDVVPIVGGVAEVGANLSIVLVIIAVASDALDRISPKAHQL